MEGILNRGWDPILPGCGGTSVVLRLERSLLFSVNLQESNPRPLAMVSQANQRPASFFQNVSRQQGWLIRCQDWLRGCREIRPSVLLVVSPTLSCPWRGAGAATLWIDETMMADQDTIKCARSKKRRYGRIAALDKTDVCHPTVCGFNLSFDRSFLVTKASAWQYHTLAFLDFHYNRV